MMPGDWRTKGDIERRGLRDQLVLSWVGECGAADRGLMVPSPRTA